MAKWQRVLATTVANVEEHFDLLKFRLRERLGNRDPIMILPYRGFGTTESLYIRGRVLEDKGIRSPRDNDSIWNNLVNMYRRFDSDEIPYALVKARFQNLEKFIRTDIEGHFELTMETTAPLSEDRLWHTIQLELVEPRRDNEPPAKAEGQAYVAPPQARFGVISDIDDTVLHTDATNLLNMARTVFLENANTRLPFKGVAAFYRALFEGAGGKEKNPLYYVSSSPWNLYDLLSDFFNLQEIPIGPILFLRDWGINERELLPTRHREYKVETIKKIMNHVTDLPFILIGDSGQEDPEIYHEIVHLYPERILAVYIRNVSRGLKRPEAINALAEEVIEAGSTLILADDTLPMAEHAAEHGWIDPSHLPKIKAKVLADEAPPTPLERLLGEEDEEEEEAPTIVIDEGDPGKTEQAVEEGAIEEALKEGEEKSKKPPTVVVEGDDEQG
jgi:phosphatidate phosphatase APP1